MISLALSLEKWALYNIQSYNMVSVLNIDDGFPSQSMWKYHFFLYDGLLKVGFSQPSIPF